MIKLKEIINNLNIVYHISRKSDLPNILKNGLIAKKPVDMNDKKGIYLFPSKDDVENALVNWLGDRLENIPIVLLTIDTNGLNIHKGDVEYEMISYNRIPPKNIIKYEDYD